MTLPIFETKQALLDSLPAVSASDFIIYNTSAQDETKPYVLITFSFFDEKVGSYFYQIRTYTTLSDFVRQTARSTGSSSSSGINMLGVNSYYYDATTSEWILYGVRSRATSVKSFLGLKGGPENIVFSTRDLYSEVTSLSYNKDGRIILSSRFTEDEGRLFNGVFQKEHLDQLGYESGDHILRLWYNEDNEALFVIKGATTPLKALITSTYYYHLTTDGTLNGLEYKSGTYISTTTIVRGQTNTLAFDDYVKYSTLDIAYEDRLLRVSDYYGEGERDQILSISPDQIQIESSYTFEAKTIPAGLEPVLLDKNLPQIYNDSGSYVTSFTAGNSRPFTHFYEAADLIGKWGRWPLPEKFEVASFYDGNSYRIVYQTAYDRTCKMLTFNMDEGCQIHWSGSSGYWYFTDKTKASNFKLYTLSKEGIGAGKDITWHSTSSSSKYLASESNVYSADAEYVLFSNVDIYNSNQSEILYPAQSLSDLSPYYFHLKGVGFSSETRVKVGEEWESLLKIDCDTTDEVQIESITFEGDYQPTYNESGSYPLVAVVKISFEDRILKAPFLLNIYNDENLTYPNFIPFPIEDGMEHFFITTYNSQIRLTSYLSTNEIYPYLYSSTQLQAFDKHPDGGYGSSVGSYLYTLDSSTMTWVFNESGQNKPNALPLFKETVMNGIGDVLFSNVSIYNTTKNEVVYEGQSFIKKPYHISRRTFPLPYDLPDGFDLMDGDENTHFFICYCGANISLVTLTPADPADFSLVQKGSYTTTLSMTPSGKMNKVVYRRFSTSTGAWGPRVTYSNVSSFDSSYVNTSTASTLNKALTLNDLIIYTTVPIYLTRSVGTDKILARDSDFKLVADENSIPPTITGLTSLNPTPYTVDTEFEFDYQYEIEPIRGNSLKTTEWQNHVPYYPVGKNEISVRTQDARELWSDWFTYEFEVDYPVIPDTIDTNNLPVKPDGNPYQHYLVSKRYSTGTSDYYCVGFDLKEGVDELKGYLVTTSLFFPKTIAEMFENCHLYIGYNETSGWGSGKYVTPSHTQYPYISHSGVNYCIADGLASYVYVSTFPIYTDDKYSTIRIHPFNKPRFPLTLSVAASHENVWTADDVNVSINIIDNGNEWRELKYRVNGGEFVYLDGNSVLTFDQTGQYRVEVFLYSADNVETIKEVSFRIDKTNPVIVIEENETSFTFRATDEHAGLETFYYRLAESDVFERSKKFIDHLTCMLSKTPETNAKNAWIEIRDGFILSKPKYGGVYVYELMAMDKVGNTYLTQHVYDLPLIPIESVELSPSRIELVYNQIHQITPVLSPSHTNEEPLIVYESQSPYISVDENGLVRNTNPYFCGEAKVSVRVNQFESELIIDCVPNKVSYPSNLPPAIDLHYYLNQFSDFIIARRSYTYYCVYAFNRVENDAIFYIDSSSNLCWSIDHTVIDGGTLSANGKRWGRLASPATISSQGSSSFYFYSKFPAESILFSSVDIYSDQSGTILAYPKQTLPNSNFSSVFFDPIPSNQWTNQPVYQVFGQDHGGGISELVYLLNGYKETVVSSGDVVTLPKSGTHQLQAIVYNDEQAPSATEFYTINLDLEAPIVKLSSREYVGADELKYYELSATISDEASGLKSLSWRINEGEWTTLNYSGEKGSQVVLTTLDQSEPGDYCLEIIVTDRAGNETFETLDFVVETPIPPFVYMRASDQWIAVATSLVETPVRVKTVDGWISLATTPTPTSLRVRVNRQWIYLRLAQTN